MRPEYGTVGINGLVKLYSLSFNPFIAPACKISGLKSAHIHTNQQYSW